MDHSTNPTLNFNSDVSWSFTLAKMWDEFFSGVSKESAFIPIMFYQWRYECYYFRRNVSEGNLHQGRTKGWTLHISRSRMFIVHLSAGIKPDRWWILSQTNKYVIWHLERIRSNMLRSSEPWQFYENIVVTTIKVLIEEVCFIVRRFLSLNVNFVKSHVQPMAGV